MTGQVRINRPMIGEFQKILEEKDFSRLETIWMEMVEKAKAPLEQYFEIASELKKIQETERAFTLLEILASQLDSTGTLPEAIAVYRNMAYYTSDDAKIRKNIARLYRKLYEKSEHLDEYLELSGLEKGGHLFKSLEKLDDFLKYDIGNVFYFDKYGLGEVVEILPVKKEVVINFERQKRYFAKFDVAKGLLTPVPAGSFLYLKYRDVNELKKMAEADEAGLVKFLLSSIKEPLTSVQIKDYLEGIASQEEIEKIWDKARKKLEHDDSIKLAGKAQKTYQYVEGGVDRADEALKAFVNAPSEKKYGLAEGYAKNREIFTRILPRLVDFANSIVSQKPGMALDFFFLCRANGCEGQLAFQLDELLATLKPEEAINELQGAEGKKQLLGIIKEGNPQTWVAIFKSLFMRSLDARLLSEIESHLLPFTEELRDINQTIFLMPHKYVLQYQWLLKKLTRSGQSEFLTPLYVLKIFESLENVKGIKSIVTKLLDLHRFDEIMKTTSADDAKRIHEVVQNNQVLADFEKKDYLKIVEYHFPQLFRKEESVIYATEVSLKKKKEELTKLLNNDIPANKIEISRAREFGDLSENFEYKAAKEKQDQLYQKVRELESELQSVKLISLAAVDASRVSVGSKVVLANVESGATIEYTILGRWDTDLTRNIISNESPLARDVLLGHACKDRIVIHSVIYEIVKITQIASP